MTIAAGASGASAHYLEPPGDWNAAPAVVQVEINFRFTVSLPDSRLVLRPYRVEVPGPRGTGAIFDPSGSVIATRATVLADQEQARIEAVNRGFAAARPSGWTNPPDLSKRHTVANAATNRQLQACYAAGSGCLTATGRSGRVVLNTVPQTRWTVGGPRDIGNGLVILPTTDARSNATPTVALNAEIPASSAFVALGYNTSHQLTRIAGQLADGKLSSTDSGRIQEAFVDGGEGVVLVGPQGKGAVLAVVVPTSTGIRLVAPQNDVAKAGYRPVRGTLHQRIDEAIGFFYGHHYTHAIPLLERTIAVFPDAGLRDYLKEAQAKKDGPEDKSMTGGAMSSPGSTGGGGLTWPWLVPVGVLVLGLVALAVLIVRQRAKAKRAAAPEGHDFDDDLDDIDGTGVASGTAAANAADRGPGSVDHSATVDPVSWTPQHTPQPAPQPTPRTDPGAGLLQAERPAEDPRAVRYCPSCGTGLVAGDRFCYQCGAPAR